MKSNKFFKKMQVLLCTATVCYTIFSTGGSAYAADNTSNSRPRISFAVLSDVHGDDTKLDNALKDLHNNVDPNYSALILNGDVVDQGMQDQYNDISTVLKNDAGIMPKKVIKNIGNHEFFNYAKGENTQDYSDQLLALNLNFTSQVHPYHDSWVNGYHFISLGTEKGYTSDMGNNSQAYLSDTQLSWFKDKLTEKYRKGKPMFVFLHQPLSHTFITTFDDANDAIQQDDALRSILSQYPEVIFFTSHTHYYYNETDPAKKDFLEHLPGVNKGFAMVDTSSVHRPVNYEGQQPPYTGDKEQDVVGASQGLFVDVYNDKVVMRGREFSDSTWIDVAKFVVSYDNQYLNQ